MSHNGSGANHYDAIVFGSGAADIDKAMANFTL